MRVKVLPPHGCDRSALDERCWMELPEGAMVSDVLRIIGCGNIACPTRLFTLWVF